MSATLEGDLFARYFTDHIKHKKIVAKGDVGTVVGPGTVGRDKDNLVKVDFGGSKGQLDVHKSDLQEVAAVKPSAPAAPATAEPASLDVELSIVGTADGGVVWATHCGESKAVLARVPATWLPGLRQLLESRGGVAKWWHRVQSTMEEELGDLWGEVEGVEGAIQARADAIVQAELDAWNALDAEERRRRTFEREKQALEAKILKAEVDAANRKLVFTVKKFQGGVEHAFRAKITLSAMCTAQARKEVGPVSLTFEIPMYNVSNLQVKYLRIAEQSKAYNPYRWVRYVTRSSSYVCRC